jgi:hypothetical protein
MNMLYPTIKNASTYEFFNGFSFGGSISGLHSSKASDRGLAGNDFVVNLWYICFTEDSVLDAGRNVG